MFERFTDGAVLAIIFAQDESQRLGHDFVCTEQILLGLIGESKGVAARALKSANITLDQGRTETEAIIGRGTGFAAKEIPFTKSSKQMLELSWQVAKRMKAKQIGTEHLLLALLEQSDNLACQVLDRLHVDKVKLKAQVLEQLQQK